MPKFIVLYDVPGEVDPHDYGPHYRGADFIDGDRVDTLFIYRELGEQFEGGERYHVLGTGTMAHITVEQAAEAFDSLMKLPDKED